MKPFETATLARPLLLLRLGLLATALLGVSPTLRAQNSSVRPSLVIGITVEGLDEECLDLLQNYFSQRGFNLLRSQGVTISDLYYGPGVDATAAAAILSTGATPSVSGIDGATVYNPLTKTGSPLLRDAGTAETYSPKRLAITTISDEVRLADGGINNVYAIAADPQQAIVTAGHAANAAAWISDTNGLWESSAFYKEVPTQLSTRNFTKPLSKQLDTLKWTPVIAPEKYPGIPTYKKAYPFRIMFPAKNVDRYRAFKVSAPGNREVTALATDLIKGMNMGGRNVTDMISVAYTLKPYPYSKEADSRLETLDAYLRLDADIASLVAAAEKGPGLPNTLIYLAGTPAPLSGKRDEERFGIPYGQFSSRKALALLNMYLIADHGNGEWVKGFHNNRVYLNNDLIRQRGLDPQAIRRKSADFLVRMEGVCEAWTLEDITSNRAGSDPLALNRNTYADHAGDVLVTVTPGWEIIDDDIPDSSVPQRPQVSRLAVSTYPAFILAPDVKPTVITDRIDADRLAPTVCRLLRIRSPNAASAMPLRLR